MQNQKKKGEKKPNEMRSLKIVGESRGFPRDRFGLPK